MAKCVKCKEKSGQIALVSGESVCNGCFCLIIEKRVLSSLRKNRILLNDGKNVFIDDGSVKSAFFSVFTKQIRGSTKADISLKKYADWKKMITDNKFLTWAKDKKSRIFLPISAEDEAETMLTAIANGDDLTQIGTELKVKGVILVKPLSCLLEKEIEEYVKIKIGKKYPRATGTGIKKMISEIETRYPGRVFGLAKSSEELSRIISKK